MGKMDEMDRNIRLRSEELGYKAVLLILGIWTLYESLQTFFNGGKHNPLPMFVLIIALCTQWFSEMYLKRKMISGDEEYKEPNKLLWCIIIIIGVIGTILSVGSYFFFRIN